MPVLSYKLRYIADFGLVETAISTNPKPTIYRNLYDKTDPGGTVLRFHTVEAHLRVNKLQLRRKGQLWRGAVCGASVDLYPSCCFRKWPTPSNGVLIHSAPGPLDLQNTTNLSPSTVHSDIYPGRHGPVQSKQRRVNKLIRSLKPPPFCLQTKWRWFKCQGDIVIDQFRWLLWG